MFGSMLGLGQWVEQCNQTMLGFQVLSNRASGKNNHQANTYIIYIYIFVSLSLTPFALFLTPSLTLNVLHSTSRYICISVSAVNS